MTETQSYDYIIAGGGMSGLSLAYYLNNSTLRNKRILIIDRSPKTSNDRTWAFWQYGTGAFEEIVTQRWKGLWVYGSDVELFMVLKDYEYKKIQGIDFYNFILPKLQENPNITFLYSPIQTIDEDYVQTEAGRFSAKYIFDSTYQLNLNLPHKHNLLQHFKGWVVKTKTPCFEPSKPTIMDFRVEQVDDHCTFFYVLPSSSTEALVEYTLFSPAVFEPEQYAKALSAYLRDFLKITDYEIIHEEFGVIPMTDEDTPEHINPHLIRIGTSGGYTKGSTGYTFERTQKYLKEIAENLENYGEPFRWKEPLKARYKWFDSVLLNVLVKKRALARDIFLKLYTRNSPDFVFNFLGERSSLWQEIKMMTTFPIIPFIKGAIEVSFGIKIK